MAKWTPFPNLLIGKIVKVCPEQESLGAHITDRRQAAFEFRIKVAELTISQFWRDLCLGNQDSSKMIQISLKNAHQHLQTYFANPSVVLGSDEKNDDLFVMDPFVDAAHCQIEWENTDSSHRIHLTNLGRSFALNSGPRIHHGVSTEVSPPSILLFGNSTIELMFADQEDEHALFLTYKPLSGTGFDCQSLKRAPAPQTLSAWFNTLGQLQRSTAASQEFFQVAAYSCVCPGGLDGAFILRPDQDNWEIVASHICYPEYGISYRKEIVDAARSSRSIVFHDAENMSRSSCKKSGHHAIACPIFDRNDECTAILYGFRTQNRRNNRYGIRPLEASFVELISQCIGNSLVRLETDAIAAKNQALLEQAFSSKVAHRLQRNPEFLGGQKRETTVMFCDLRGFSGIAENISADLTHEFLNDVMDQFTNIIENHDGVVIDYYGDGVSAFWNAPVDDPRHAEKACRCAMEISQAIPRIDDAWSRRLRGHINAGIGIHTGIARVGNSGSRSRIKYGPQGNTVNLAARLESATKHIKANILISDATRLQLGDSFLCRRVCRTQLGGMKNTTELFELISESPDEDQLRRVRSYEAALNLYESGNIQLALERLTEVLDVEHQFDEVSDFLLECCVEQLQMRPDGNRPSTKQKITPWITELPPLESPPVGHGQLSQTYSERKN